jgi:DNA adenine methylase
VDVAPSRPLLRWHGGKWLLAPWLTRHFPPHRTYVEPYGGGASVLLRKERSYAEVYNDLDNVLVNLFRLLRDPVKAAELVRQLEMTPFARAEFNAAYEVSGDPLEDARRAIVRSFMGFGSDSTAGHYRTGFRCNVTRQGTTPARDWMGYPAALRLAIERLRGVTIEARPALEVLQRFDGDEALFYVDPPYLPETRSQGNRRRCGPGTQAYEVYTHELDTEDHVILLDRLRGVRGMVLLSGYPSDLYDDALADWRRVERPHLADGARPRTEVLWINPAADAALSHGPLFEEAA